MKYCVTILFLSAFQFSFSQMKVEDIKDDSTAIIFVKKVYVENEENDFNKISFCDKEEKFYKRDSTVQAYYNFIKAPKWIKSDLNKDGKEDLTFCGCVGFREKIICFISANDQKYNEKYITPEDLPESYFVKKIDDNYLIIGNIDLYNFDTTKNLLKSINYDTISFSNNSLIQYSSAKRKIIDSIKLNFIVELMPKEFTIMIRKTGLLYLSKIEDYNYYEHSYQMNVGKENVDSFFDIAENLPYYKYKDKYFGGADDGYDWNTTIYFNDGSIMHISDHMGVAPFGLRTLYDVAYKLFKDENWKKID
jgi:hypothetical protein